jgi:hypothetical protein
MSFVGASDFPVDLALRVLGIAPSTYYGWRARQAAPSRRQLDDAQLLEMIVKVRTSHEFAGTYGSPRVWLALRRQGVRCGRGHDHPHAIRILARAWIRVIWPCWINQVPYDPGQHGNAARLARTE